MRKVLFLLIAIAFIDVTGAQGQPSKVAAEGNKAILFNFSGFNANTYMGGIGGKYFVSDGLGLRGMLMFGIDNKTTNTPIQQTDNSLSFGIGIGLEYHLPSVSGVSPYLGGGLSYATNSTTSNPGSAKTTTNKFSLGALGGFEYFFTQNVSLGAEYQLGIAIASNTPAGGSSSDEFTFGFQTAGLTLGFYF
jgi:opacity protein-like surface antigen